MKPFVCRTTHYAEPHDASLRGEFQYGHETVVDARADHKLYR
jgi:hypothetical protein